MIDDGQSIISQTPRPLKRILHQVLGGPKCFNLPHLEGHPAKVLGPTCSRDLLARGASFSYAPIWRLFLCNAPHREGTTETRCLNPPSHNTVTGPEHCEREKESLPTDQAGRARFPSRHSSEMPTTNYPVNNETIDMLETPAPLQQSAQHENELPLSMLVAPAPQQNDAGVFQLHDILLQVALAHALPTSGSPLAALPREVVHLQIVRHVRELFLADLAVRGLLTPVQMKEEDFCKQSLSQPPKLAKRASQLLTSTHAPRTLRKGDAGIKWVGQPPRVTRPLHILARPFNLLTIFLSQEETTASAEAACLQEPGTSSNALV